MNATQLDRMRSGVIIVLFCIINQNLIVLTLNNT